MFKIYEEFINNSKKVTKIFKIFLFRQRGVKMSPKKQARAKWVLSLTKWPTRKMINLKDNKS